MKTFKRFAPVIYQIKKLVLLSTLCIKHIPETINGIIIFFSLLQLDSIFFSESRLLEFQHFLINIFLKVSLKWIPRVLDGQRLMLSSWLRRRCWSGSPRCKRSSRREDSGPFLLFPCNDFFPSPQPALAGARAPQSVTCYRVPRHPAAKIIERGRPAARGWHSKIIRSIKGTDAATPLGSCFLLFFLHITESVGP